MDFGGVYATLGMYLMPLTLKMVKLVNFMECVFYENLKREGEVGHCHSSLWVQRGLGGGRGPRVRNWPGIPSESLKADTSQLTALS